MWRLKYTEWSFSGTAEVATGVLLMAAVVSVLLV